MYKGETFTIMRERDSPESKIITVSADVKLMPRPPAFVDNKKQKSLLLRELNCSIAFFRTSFAIVPSRRWREKREREQTEERQVNRDKGDK